MVIFFYIDININDINDNVFFLLKFLTDCL